MEKKKLQNNNKNEKKNTTHKPYSDEINKDTRPKATAIYERKAKREKNVKKDKQAITYHIL